MTKENVIKLLVAFYNFNEEDALQEVEAFQERHALENNIFPTSAANLIAAFD